MKNAHSGISQSHKNLEPQYSFGLNNDPQAGKKVQNSWPSTSGSPIMDSFLSPKMIKLTSTQAWHEIFKNVLVMKCWQAWKEACAPVTLQNGRRGLSPTTDIENNQLNPSRQESRTFKLGNNSGFHQPTLPLAEAAFWYPSVCYPIFILSDWWLVKLGLFECLENGGEGTRAQGRLSLNWILMDSGAEFQIGQPTAKKFLMQMNLIAATDVLPVTFFQQKWCLVRQFADAPHEAIPELIQQVSNCRNTGFLNLFFSMMPMKRTHGGQFLGWLVISNTASVEDMHPYVLSIIVIVQRGLSYCNQI